MTAGPRPLLALLLLAAALPGCAAFQGEAAADLAGIGGAAIADAVGASDGLTAGIGFGARAATRAGLQYAQRKVRGAAQDEVARAAGPLPVGGIARWATDHPVPLEPDEAGRVTVARLVSAGPIACKEIVFSVEARDGERMRERFYTANICRDGETWRWASAEPAVGRWGSLQ